MNSLSSVFSISFQQEFVYRTNFIMWRVRNITQIFLTYFLWSTLFSSQSILFGYSQSSILSYIFGILILKAIVFSARSTEVAGEISRGDLSNYLIKPINYFKYWFTRDLSSKLLNIVFMFIEILLLYLLLRPTLFLQTDLIFVLFFLISLFFAIVLYFLLLMIFSMIPFWFPTEAWGAVFLLSIFTELLGGAVFPLDIFPIYIQKLIFITPFPHLLFVPLQIYLGKLNLDNSFNAIIVSAIWSIGLSIVLNILWRRGLRSYRAEGR